MTNFTRLKIKSPTKNRLYIYIYTTSPIYTSAYIYIYIYIYIYRHLYCNSYSQKSGHGDRFKSWTRLYAFYIALLPTEKVGTKYSPSTYE